MNAEYDLAIEYAKVMFADYVAHLDKERKQDADLTVNRLLSYFEEAYAIYINHPTWFSFEGIKTTATEE